MPSGTPSSAVVLERLDGIIASIDRIECSVTALASDYRQFRENYSIAHEQVRSQVELAHKRIDTLELELKTLSKLHSDTSRDLLEIKHLVWQLRGLLIFIGTSFGALIITLIWRMITGEISIMGM